MAKSIQEYQQQMETLRQADSRLNVLNSVSKTALFKLFEYIVAYIAHQVDVVFDLVKAEITDIVDRLKPHSLRWYSTIAKEFQYGYSLPNDSDKYDNTGLDPDLVEQSKIIAYVAVDEDPAIKQLVVKVAKQGTDLENLTPDELTAFSSYMSRVKDAGVQVSCESDPADQVQAEYIIYYDPLILDSQGRRIDGTNDTPVLTAFKEYLKNLPFNGVLVPTYVTDAIQEVEGVVIPVLKGLNYKYGNLPFIGVQDVQDSNAGYFRLENDSDLVLNYEPQAPLR